MIKINFSQFKIFGCLLFTFIWGGVFYGCATKAPQETNAFLLGERPVFKSSAVFEKLTKTEPGSKDYEKARIDYLFERLSKSKYNFVRNQQVYSPTRAVMHLRWKQFRFRNECLTAEMFIKNCAEGSRMSGDPYLIKYRDSEYYPLHVIFINELELLDDEFIRHQEELKKKLEVLQKEKQAIIQSEVAKELPQMAPVSPEEASTVIEEEEAVI